MKCNCAFIKRASAERAAIKMSDVKITTTSQIVALHSEGYNVSEIAKKLDIKYQHVYNTLTNKKLDFVTKDRSNSKSEKIRTMFVAGSTKSEIAKELDITFQHVYNVLKNAKLIESKKS